MKKYDIFLNVIATIIIAVAVIGILIISFNYLSSKSVKVTPVVIEYHRIKTDSTDIKKEEVNKLDSFFNSIKETSNKIQERQLQLIEDKENDNFFNKLYTAIVAIILAIAGFFGFKSISEIKTRAIEDAKQEAIKIAKEEFKNTFNDEYESKVFQKSTEAMTEFLRNEIANLESRIASIEEAASDNDPGDDQDTSASNNIVEPANPFEDA